MELQGQGVGRSWQRLDFMDGLILLSGEEQIQELGLMECGPFEDHAECSWCDMASHDSQPLNVDFDRVFAIVSMKMRGIVIRKINTDNNAVKTADLRHGPTLVAARGKTSGCLPVIRK